MTTRTEKLPDKTSGVGFTPESRTLNDPFQSPADQWIRCTAQVQMELVKKKPAILVIDDDDQIRRLLLNIFNQGYDCWEAGSAEAALLVLAQQSFDLVISDINMSGMSGLALVPHVHSISADTIVLMISGQPNTETAMSALHA